MIVSAHCKETVSFNDAQKMAKQLDNAIQVLAKLNGYLEAIELNGNPEKHSTYRLTKIRKALGYNNP